MAQPSSVDTARRSVAVTPSDTAPLSPIPCALYVGTGGDITLREVGGAVDVVWKNVPNGGYVFTRPEYVKAATTATDILALYNQE